MIGGNNIIWIDTRSGGEQIYLYDIATGKEQQITTVKSFKHSPVMAGDKIVWIDSRNGEDKWDVYLYNLTSHEEIPICTNSARQVQPWIYGDTVVWADGRNKNWDIYTYNLTTKTEQPVVTNSANQGYPMIYGDYIAWLDVRQGDPDIYLYDTKKDVEVPVATLPLEQVPNDGVGEPFKVKPHLSSKIISGNKIVWTDKSSGHDQIKMRYITSDPLLLLNADFPSTNGSLLVWSDNRGGSWNIYGFDFFTRSEKPISRGDWDQLYPRASGDRVVWSDYRNGDSDIYLKNLTTGVESAVTTGKGDQICLPSQEIGLSGWITPAATGMSTCEIWPKARPSPSARDLGSRCILSSAGIWWSGRTTEMATSMFT